MKKFILFMLLCLSTAAFAQNDNGWEKWQQTSCYSKIWFRLKYVEKRGEQNVWKVQFKNNYDSVISFNYNITDKLQQYNLTTHRKSINQKQVSDEVEVYTSLEDLYLVVDKVSLSPYPKDFIDCETE